MDDWRGLRAEGLGPIERVVGIFQVGPPLERLPFPSFKVKVLEREDGSFLAVPNVAPLGSDGHPSWEAGSGTSVGEALEDALRALVRLLDELRPSTESDFGWSDPTEF
jgi:hypothetical protein